jgi:hypothetical protein
MRTIMGWIAFAKRELKHFELQSAMAFHYQLSKLSAAQVFDLCKPLVELGPDGSLVFIHISVQGQVNHYGLGNYGLNRVLNSSLPPRAVHFFAAMSTTFIKLWAVHELYYPV